jgi:hypothetical protein
MLNTNILVYHSEEEGCGAKLTNRDDPVPDRRGEEEEEEEFFSVVTTD